MARKFTNVKARWKAYEKTKSDNDNAEKISNSSVPFGLSSSPVTVTSAECLLKLVCRLHHLLGKKMGKCFLKMMSCSVDRNAKAEGSRGSQALNCILALVIYLVIYLVNDPGYLLRCCDFSFGIFFQTFVISPG